MSLLFKKIISRNFCLAAIVVSCLYSSFAVVSKLRAGYSKTEQTAVDIAKKNEPVGETAINKTSLTGNIENQSSSGGNLPEKIKILADDSQIQTTYDGFGNKTEIRVFSKHPRLKLLMLRTSVNGERQIYVHGQNGEVEGLPENMLDKAISISADEIANSAGITETRRENTRPSFAQTNKVNPGSPRQPVPVYQSPIQEPPFEQPQTEEPKKPESKTVDSNTTSPIMNENI